jgi:CubicO group peptidase (beta-lactamase class C family)
MRRSLCTAAVAIACLVAGVERRSAAEPLPTGDWMQHGLSTDQRAQIIDAFEQGIRRRIIPGGALLIIHRGEVILRQGFGLADLAARREFTADTPCRIASVTKPHTATLLVLLAERGQLTLDQPIDRWIPGFRGVRLTGGAPAARAPTLSECLSHTSGFPGNDAIKRGTLDLPMTGTLEETVAELSRRELLAEPGTRWDYSRLGYMAAGRVAEIVTGRSYASLLETELLDPIGATSATFEVTPELEARMAVAYQRGRGGFVPRRPDMELESRTPNPGGGLIATLDDVGRLLLLHRNRGRVGERRLLKPESLARMYVAQPGTNGNGYGLGFNVLATRPDGTTSRVQHIGASGTLAWLDFDADLGIVVLTQVPTPQIQNWRNQLVRTITTVFRTSADSAPEVSE